MAPSAQHIEWPTGGFDWNAKLRSQLPIMRGVHAPEFRVMTNLLPHRLDFRRKCNPYNALETFLTQRTSGDAWQDPIAPWTETEALAKLAPAALAKADPEYWRELFWQCAAQAYCRPEMVRVSVPQMAAAGSSESRDFAVPESKLPRDHVLWAADAAIALHSLAFATRLFLECRNALISPHRSHVYYGHLRRALAAAPEDQHLAARRVAEDLRGTSPELDSTISYLFPEIAEWAEECAARYLPHQNGRWLNHAALSPETFLRHYRGCHTREMDSATVLLQIHLHDEAAWPLLQELLEGRVWYGLTDCISLVCRMRTPALIPALMERIERSNVRAALEKLAVKWPAAVLKSVMDQAIASRSGILEALAAHLAAHHPVGLATVVAAATEAERQRYTRAFSFLAPPPEEAPTDLVPEALRQPPQGEKILPKLPGFFLPGTFHRPRLLSGQALPFIALENLGYLLAASTLSEPRPALAEIKAACTPESLAEFAWDLFEAWQAAGNPTKAIWGLTSLGLLGDASTARRLVPQIQAWRKQLIHLRANLGIDILAAIGNDAALMYLHGIIGKPLFKNLRDKAKAKIEEIAEARGLSPDQLADRLVPDLGLDQGGTLELDYGPRRFRVAFDEALKPFVTNAEGTRLKDLPKPNKSDDEILAPAALARYKALKKDAKAVATLQIARLEQSMCARRRWSGEEFRALFLEHPLMRHLARRLVWGVYRDGTLVDAFRVAEDATLADRRDDLYEIPDGVDIGIVHALELPEDLSRDFGQIFADYEILQPFKQLGRETYALAEAERQAGTITRFDGREVSSGGVMGLIGRGWEWGSRESYLVDSLRRRLPEGLHAELWISPGIAPADPRGEPVQEIKGPEVLRYEVGGFRSERVDIAGLDPVVVSEIIRDVDLLAAVSK